jgi:hypothetical protein
MKKLNTLNMMMLTMDTMKHEEREHKSKCTQKHTLTRPTTKTRKTKLNLQASQVDDKKKNDITKDRNLQNDVYGGRTMMHTEVNKREGMK